MTHRRLLLALFVLFVGTSLVGGGALAQLPSKAPKPVYTPPAEGFGYVPPPVDLSGLMPAREAAGALELPASWDWRLLGGVTSVKNQNPYGTCWAFAGLGDLESKLLINEAAAFDFSEINVVACNPVGTSCDDGGNAWITTNYLSLLGTVNEACNAYPDGCPVPACVNPACPFGRRVTEWRVIANDVTAIKQAVMTYGPVYVGIYASFPGFSTYDGTTCLTYTGTDSPNHAVLIVGWDNAMCGGAGAWIVKNSWGTSWGDDGYFYIHYGDARIGTDASVYTGSKPYDANEKIYHYDEWGWWSSVGYQDGDDYGMVVIVPSGTPAGGALLRAVDFWATWSPTSYTIEIYDDWNGSAFSGLLAGPFSGTKAEAGYYSEALPLPIPVRDGDALYIKMRFTTAGYGYPIPFDDSGTMETNKSYVSSTGLTWSALDLGGYSMGDIGIRARVEPVPSDVECSLEGDPVLFYGWNALDGLPFNQPGPDYATTYQGGSLTRQVAPCNVPPTWLPAGCKEQDTLCFHATSARGWDIACDPSMGLPRVIDPSYYWYQNVTITAPCGAAPGTIDTVIAICAYTNVLGVCDASCGDCNDPNIRPSDGLLHYSSDTLIITVLDASPPPEILQDTLTLVELGQTEAYVPFAICNRDVCVPSRMVYYSIATTGHLPATIPGGSVDLLAGSCENVYAVLDAGAAPLCTYDTLTIVAWTGVPAAYDTCVQIIHVVEAQEVPLMTPVVVAILIAALVVVAGIFMWRRTRAKQ